MSEPIKHVFSDKRVASMIEKSFIDYVYEKGVEDGHSAGFKSGKSLISFWWYPIAWLGWMALGLFLGLAVFL